MSPWTKPLYQYSHMVLFVFSIGRNVISTSLLITFWFYCWFCQCNLGSERGKTSITHIPSRHAPLSYWHIKCGNRWTSHDTKVVALLLHPSYRAMRRFHVQHKAVYSPTDWPNWANPFCLLEVHLVPSLSSYWKSQLPQGRYGLDLCAEAFFILFRLFLFTILWKLRLDQQNAHSKGLFSCMCLNASRSSKVYMLVDREILWLKPDQIPKRCCSPQVWRII